jgi:pilus assembly protein FimV
MIHNNKILTVSYGTFSCTLEGFDDSFGTMKAIAEYFRDLSADDRYFGSEPLQPDAQMLARIAQREISRHVDAREDKGRIVLSARSADQTPEQVAHDAVEDVAVAVADAAVSAGVRADSPAAPARVAPARAAPDTRAAPDSSSAPAETMAPAAPAVAQSDEDSPAPDAAEDVPTIPTQTPAPQTLAPDIVPSLPDADVEAFFADGPAREIRQTAPQEPEDDAQDTPALERIKADSIAEKLKRIRAVVSQQSVQPEAPEYSEDQHADAAAPKAAAAPAPLDVSADLPEEARDVLAETVRDLEEALDTDDGHDATPDEDETYESEDDDIAAILSRLEREARIDAPVAQTGDTGADDASLDDEDLFEDEIDETEDMRDNILAALETRHADPDADGSAGQRTYAYEDDTEGSDADEAYESENLFDAPAGTSAPAPEAGTPTPAPTVQNTALIPPPPPRTRVLKVKRATLEAAIRSGQLEEYEENDTAEDLPRDQGAPSPSTSSPSTSSPSASSPSASSPSAPSPLRKAPLADRSTLSAEAEEDLSRELAELEAEMSGQGHTVPADTPQADPRDAAHEDTPHAAAHEDIQRAAAHEDIPRAAAHEDIPRAAAHEDPPAQSAEPSPRAQIGRDADEDFSRLMQEADHQMEEPESTTRRDAFTHLRAAVAAKKADEAVGGGAGEEESDEAYRDDLANVVRPRRPSSGDRPRTERPAEQRPAPLKLVAEQRIDLAQPRTIAPVRPRRVSALSAAACPPDAAAQASNFTDFAAQMGAQKLPDLLEAAAAYLSFVEGHAQFSRPQLMTKVRQVEQENFTREDSLRSFGKLLREGKIEKLEGGRFQASEQIGFKPDARAAG